MELYKYFVPDIPHPSALRAATFPQGKVLITVPGKCTIILHSFLFVLHRKTTVHQTIYTILQSDENKHCISECIRV